MRADGVRATVSELSKARQGRASWRRYDRKENAMSVAKVTEITANSNDSFEDAIEQGIMRADKTLKNIRSAWIKDQQVTVDNGRITEYRVSMKVTFVLND
jgi:flavin-binding protein dodecin